MELSISGELENRIYLKTYIYAGPQRSLSTRELEHLYINLH